MIRLNSIETTSTSQAYAVVITEKLCKPFCEKSLIQPTADVNFKVDSSTFRNGVQYVKVKVQGIVNYVAKDDCPCRPSSRIFTEYFTLAFLEDKEQPIKIEYLDGYVEPTDVRCGGLAFGVSWVGAIVVGIDS